MATVEQLRRALAAPPATLTPSAGRAAVAAVLAPAPAGWELLLVRRTARPGDPWSGHLAFPGGRVEPGEDPFAAALRETVEEVGWALDPSWLLGRLDDLPAVGGRPGMVIHPFVFLAPALPTALTPQPAEVEEALWVPLRHLLSDEGRGPMEWRRGELRATLPKVELPTTPVPLWGLTLRMVDDLLHRLDGRGVGLERVPR